MNPDPTSPAAMPEIATSRFRALDILRGIALLGLLFMSIREFGGFSSNQQIFYITGNHGGNYRLITIMSLLFEGKMESLLALVFGAGIILFLQKKGHPISIGAPDAYIRRQIWLIVFGLFNALILLWPGDILYHFGIVGILLFAFWKLPAKGLFICALVCTLVYCGKNYWSYAEDKGDYKKYLAVTAIEKNFKTDSITRANKDSLNRGKDSSKLKTLLPAKPTDSAVKKKDTLTSKQAEEKSKWEGIVKRLKYDSSRIKTENKEMQAGYGKIWNNLKGRTQYKEASWLYSIGVWDMGSMMFLGMALLGIGFFYHRFSATNYFVLAIVLLAAGFALAWYRIHNNNLRIEDYTKYIESQALPYNQFLPLEKVLLVTGIAAKLMWLLRIKFFDWAWYGLSAVGRMAFTNYLMQTIICSFFFYGYGFGYFGRLEQCQLYFVAGEIILVQIVFSILWLRYYSMGPVEWLWNCLIYRKWLSIKKQGTEPVVSSAN